MRIAILLLSSLLSSIAAWAQSGLNRPFVGQMIDREQFLRPVYGVSGNFSVEKPVAERVMASACSAAFCLAKTETALVSPASVTPAPLGDARIGLDGTGATIYFPQTGQFGRWQHGLLTMLDLEVDGAVLSLRSNPLNVAVQRSGSVWILAGDGTILDSLPAETGAVLLLSNSLVYALPGSLVLRKSDHTELRFPAPAVTALSALGDGYVEAASGKILYALRVVPGREQLFQLPQPVQLPVFVPQPTQREPRR